MMIRVLRNVEQSKPLEPRHVRGVTGSDVMPLHDRFENHAFDFAYQGAPGAFSEEAGLAVVTIDSREARALACSTFDGVFAAVEMGRAALGVVPVENTLAGPIYRVLDLIEASGMQIVAEYTLRISHALIGCPGAELDQIQRAHSHPVALAQCGRFLADRRIEATEAFDTAGAVGLVVSSGSLHDAAIAGVRAADVYGGVVLAEAIADSSENFTRFVVVRR